MRLHGGSGARTASARRSGGGVPGDPRIDYYPDKDADALIRSMTGRFVGGDFSSVINRIVGEWAERAATGIE